MSKTSQSNLCPIRQQCFIISATDEVSLCYRPVTWRVRIAVRCVLYRCVLCCMAIQVSPASCTIAAMASSTTTLCRSTCRSKPKSPTSTSAGWTHLRSVCRNQTSRSALGSNEEEISCRIPYRQYHIPWGVLVGCRLSFLFGPWARWWITHWSPLKPVPRQTYDYRIQMLNYNNNKETELTV